MKFTKMYMKWDREQCLHLTKDGCYGVTKQHSWKMEESNLAIQMKRGIVSHGLFY